MNQDNSATVMVSDLDTAADRLTAALAAYERFVAAEGQKSDFESLPTEPRDILDDTDSKGRQGIALTEVITDRYYEAREIQAKYVQQVRERDRPDWDAVLAMTESGREASRRVHTIGPHPRTEAGDPHENLSREACPACRVSMNAGSELVVYDDRREQYRAVTAHFDISPEVVYHPASGHDVSPSAAFPEARVVYVDVDAAAMADLREAGYEGVAADAAGYEVKAGADLIVFRNAGLMEEPVVVSNLRAGGWVLANDHLESARHLTALDELELVGVVPDEWLGGDPSVVTTDLNAYRTRLTTPPADCRGKGSSLDLYVFQSTDV